MSSACKDKKQRWGQLHCMELTCHCRGSCVRITHCSLWLFILFRGQQVCDCEGSNHNLLGAHTLTSCYGLSSSLQRRVPPILDLQVKEANRLINSSLSWTLETSKHRRAHEWGKAPGINTKRQGCKASLGLEDPGASLVLNCLDPNSWGFPKSDYVGAQIHPWFQLVQPAPWKPGSAQQQMEGFRGSQPLFTYEGSLLCEGRPVSAT